MYSSIVVVCHPNIQSCDFCPLSRVKTMCNTPKIWVKDKLTTSHEESPMLQSICNSISYGHILNQQFYSSAHTHLSLFSPTEHGRPHPQRGLILLCWFNLLRCFYLEQCNHMSTLRAIRTWHL